MSKLEQRKELALKSIALIDEFIGESSLICEYFIRDIKPNDDFTAICYNDDFEGFIEYPLTNVSGILRGDMEGFAPCGGSGFYEAVDHAIHDLEYDFKNYKSKEEYIQYAGSIYYMKVRCEQIYKELKNIDEQATSLID